MSVDVLKKYAYLYAGLSAVTALRNSDTSAFLLCGEDADGLAVLARIVAARIQGMPDERAFDEHADIIVYPQRQDVQKPKSKAKTEEKQKRYAMTVDDVKDIVDSLYLTPFELEKRVYIIECAESMSEICQNKLLKSLEEPPPRVCFVLCSTGNMLPTVESRCNRIELPPFSVETVETELSKFHADKSAVALAARASRGNIGLAERVLEDVGFADTYATAKKVIALATGSKMFSRVASVYDKLPRDKADALLGTVEYLLNDIARYAIGVPTVFDRKEIEEISGGFTPYSAAKSCEYVRTARKHIVANCMPQAVLDTLMLKIMQEKSEQAAYATK